MTPLSPGESGKYHQSTKRVICELASCFAGHVEWDKSSDAAKLNYKATAGAFLCCCRLCGSTGEDHFKNILAKGNRVPVTSKGEELDNVTSYLESMLIKTSALMNKLNNYVRN